MLLRERLLAGDTYIPNYEMSHFPEVIQLGGIQIHLEIPEGRLNNRTLGSLGIVTSTGPLTEERIFEKTGIEVRAQADPDETVQSLGKKAARPLLQQASNKINAVVFMTSYPSIAGLEGKENHAQAIARRLDLTNLAESVEGFIDDEGKMLPEALDWHKACSSFADWFSHIQRYQQQYNSFDEALLISSEIFSPTLPRIERGEMDPSLSPTILGDMAAALRFRPGKDITVLATTTLELPHLSNAICMPVDYSAIRQPAHSYPVPTNEYFSMQGKTIYKAIPVVSDMIVTTLDKAGLPHDKVRKILCHQASFPVLARIQESLPQNLRDKMYINVREGNYSSATILKALAEEITHGNIHNGDNIVFAGFGAGLYASVAAVKIGE
ncbi:MAG: hypothetical protein HYT11_03150 [Candidatus Levybacteria bacterium]|nr:hypothetical protein [Candidatus Levybacteria bacterium]